MSQPVPDGLPVWVQALIYVATILGSFGAAILGWKRKANPPSDAPNTLIAGDIMSTRPMQDLARAVESIGEGQTRVIEAIDRNTSAVDRMERATERLNTTIERLWK